MATEVTPGFPAYLKEPASPQDETRELSGKIDVLVWRELPKRKGFKQALNALNVRLTDLKQQECAKANGAKGPAYYTNMAETEENPDIILENAVSASLEGEFDSAIDLAKAAETMVPNDPFPLVVHRSLLAEKFKSEVQASLTRRTRKGQLHQIAKRHEISQQAAGAKQRRLF